MRSRFARLLASTLVVVSLLVNGLAFAQAPSAPTRQHDCAEMMGQQQHGDCCDEGGQPCPAPGGDCDEQCMFRCQSTAAILSVVAPIPVGDGARSALAPLPATESPPTVLVPALRPPISA
jgi:hypothetical protein